MEGIIGFASCLLCALPFFIIGAFDKNSSTPISFWSGDRALKDKIENVPEYNRRMSKVYLKWGIGFLAAGACCFFNTVAGIAVLFAVCTAGTYIAYKCYSNIRKDCSYSESLYANDRNYTDGMKKRRR